MSAPKGVPVAPSSTFVLSFASNTRIRDDKDAKQVTKDDKAVSAEARGSLASAEADQFASDEKSQTIPSMSLQSHDLEYSNVFTLRAIGRLDKVDF
jgi:hypothetical protein